MRYLPFNMTISDGTLNLNPLDDRKGRTISHTLIDSHIHTIDSPGMKMSDKLHYSLWLEGAEGMRKLIFLDFKQMMRGIDEIVRA